MKIWIQRKTKTLGQSIYMTLNILISACTKKGRKRSWICVIIVWSLFLQFSVGFCNCLSMWYLCICTLNILAHFTRYHLTIRSLGCKQYSWYANQLTLNSDKSITKSKHQSTYPLPHIIIVHCIKITHCRSISQLQSTNREKRQNRLTSPSTLLPPPHTLFGKCLRYFSIDLRKVKMMSNHIPSSAVTNENFGGLVLLTKNDSLPYFVNISNRYVVSGDNPVRSKVVASLWTLNMIDELSDLNRNMAIPALS